MTYKSKTLRRMPPLTREVARLINELDSVTTRLKNRIPALQDAELDSIVAKRQEAASLNKVLNDPCTSCEYQGTTECPPENQDYCPKELWPLG